MVVNVMISGPASDQRLPEAPAMDSGMTKAVSGISCRQRAAEQQGDAHWRNGRQKACPRQHRQRRRKKWQRVIAGGILVMLMVPSRQRANITVEQPTVKTIFDEAEENQAATNDRSSDRGTVWVTP